MIEAKKLRCAEELKKIPNDKPGYYKWWSTKDAFEQALNALGMDIATIEAAVEKSGEYYCIYVGIAAKESIRKRLDWHVNDKHTAARVQNGTLSTLRQSIASVVAHNQYDKEATDEWIDRLLIEYHCVNCPIKSAEAAEVMHRTERELLATNLYIFNIMENYHPLAGDIKRKLKALRKASK